MVSQLTKTWANQGAAQNRCSRLGLMPWSFGTLTSEGSAVGGTLGIMKTMSRRWITSGSVAIIGISVATAFLWSGSQSQTLNVLRIDRVNETRRPSGLAAPQANVVPDNYPRSWFSLQTAKFHMTCTQAAAIFVHSTGVQIHTDSGWKPFSEQPRNEIWRLKPGFPQEIFVDSPQREKWRAYFRFGKEMKGPQLWYWQSRGAWQDRSFTNWTGKAWGGGRFTGANELFIEEFAE